MLLTLGVPSFILWFSQAFDYEVLKTEYSLMQHEWQCQQDTIGRLKIDVIKLRSQLNQQARFCSKLGSVFGYRLWKATRIPEVVNAMTQQVGNDMRDKRISETNNECPRERRFVFGKEMRACGSCSFKAQCVNYFKNRLILNIFFSLDLSTNESNSTLYPNRRRILNICFL